MERRIAGIIRWLDRCLAAWKAGALESALMDAECARADMERLRDDVWNALEQKHVRVKHERAAIKSLKASLLAMAAVLAAATPLAILQEGRAFPEPVRVTLEWVTPDEKTLLGNLRKHLSESNSFAAASERDDMYKPGTLAANAVHQPSGTQNSGMRNAPARERAERSSNSVPYDRIISLVQAGEKALKNEQPLIRIEK